MNKVVLIGRLTRDPEVRYTPSQKVVCSFTLAVDRPFQNQQGQREADFIPIVLWGKTAEVAGNSLSKGHRLGVSGRMQTRNYDDKDGKKVWVTEVIGDNIEFLEKRESSANRNQGYGQQSYGQGYQGQASAPPPQQPAPPPAPQYQQQDAFSKLGTQVPFDEEVPF
ncbi:MAG: single-stranded DNA-binding protein [Acidaminococcaceae bacterium]|nr:single-stranded DNA-binding protein [Acidaminococcaceae bacterium]